MMDTTPVASRSTSVPMRDSSFEALSFRKERALREAGGRLDHFVSSLIFRRSSLLRWRRHAPPAPGFLDVDPKGMATHGLEALPLRRARTSGSSLDRRIPVARASASPGGRASRFT